MAYKSSPRPTFDGPTAIPYGAVTRHLWGEPEAGLVADWIYVSSDRIHQLVFGLPPGDGFRHSPSFRTVFGADEILFVLQGTMVIANPETGEVQRAETGEAVFFRKDTWHHAWAFGADELRVLEYFAPPPSTGTSGAYAQTRSYVAHPRYARPQWHGRWPAGQREAEREGHFQVLRSVDRLWALDSSDPRVLTGIIASTDQLTAGVVSLSPGGKSASRRHGGAAGLYVRTGRVNILIEQSSVGPTWFELGDGDGFYVPENVEYRAFNMSAKPAEYLFGVAPRYDAISADAPAP